MRQIPTLTDEHGYIERFTGRYPGQIVDRKAELLGKTAKKWDIPNKKTEKGSLYYLKKRLK